MTVSVASKVLRAELEEADGALARFDVEIEEQQRLLAEAQFQAKYRQGKLDDLRTLRLAQQRTRDQVVWQLERFVEATNPKDNTDLQSAAVQRASV